jgi:hypothetical protein
MQIYVILILVIMIGLLSLIPDNKQFQFSGKIIFLFRIFFPSWKFFDVSSDMYYIKYRSNNIIEKIEQCEWILCPPKLERNISQVIFNPQGNIALACDTIQNHLLTDIYELQGDNKSFSELEKTTSYKIIQNMITFFISKTNETSFQYQFKIASLDQDNEEDDIFISPIYISE